MSRYPTTPQSQFDNQSIGLSSYQRSETRPSPSSRSQPTTSSNNYPSSNTGSSAPDPEQSRRTARIHYDQLNGWLYQGQGSNSKSSQNRTNPRDKLTRLTRQQFQELSTDVYDELCRRIERGEQDGGEGKGGSPFLLSRDEYHPKRNQARQKLATLPRSRFKDLASDVFFELERRYPEFLEPEFAPTPPRNNYPNSQASSNKPPSDPRHRLPPNPSQASSSSKPPLRPLQPSNGVAGGVLANDVIVPDKSTFVMDQNEAYDDASSIRSGPSKLSLKSNPLSSERERDNQRERDRPPETASTERSDYFGVGNSSKRGSGSLSSLKYISNKSLPSEPRSPVKDRSGSIRSTHEYERRISVMQTKIKNLEQELEQTQRLTEMRAEDSERISDLEEQLTTMKERCARQREELKELEDNLEDQRNSNSREMQLANEEISRLKQEIGDLERENSRAANKPSLASTAIVDRLKDEVKDLLNELRQLQIKQDELVADREADQETIRELEEDVTFNKKRYEAAKTELRHLKRTSVLHATKNFIPSERFPVTGNGAIADIHFTAFTSSIDELLQAGRSNGNNEVITAMRTVITAVGTVDEDIQQFEANISRTNSLSSEDRDKLEGLKARINATLSNLITAAKNHVVSLGLSPISLLDAASSHLSFSMIELVKLVGMRKANTMEVERYENYHSNGRQDEDDDSLSILASQTQFSHLNKNGNGSIDKNSNKPSLKIIRDQQKEDTKLTSLRSPFPLKPLHIRPDENRFPDTRQPVTPPKTPFKNIRDLQSAYDGTTSPEAGHRSQQSASISKLGSKYEAIRSPSGFDGSNESDLRDSASGSSTTNLEKVFDSPPRRANVEINPLPTSNGTSRGLAQYEDSDVKDISNFGLGVSRAEDEEREKLKAYLETQTESIVAYIQTLLSAIRGGGAQGSQALTENLTQIITIVSSIVAMTTDSLPPKPETDRILNELSNNCNRLSEMQEISGSTIFTKQTKQAMAAASFGVAKALKELNSYIAGDDVTSVL
ncbi:uncharacterized protein MELLADRAFT_115294 [Melampsora larici-populina 98AG31]|uniref:GIT Spa2 homology (SHD) domain-containing protein n=1 Tax=Melampsora larici-populina (strain 98AG31 / pathotype 3-4-7) TaxID=747676 RepID=F4R763_MELLP|nr:uncharacterized protein MELLADRAFT_115294 [Melampsora larici-populina 98AG31]EGG11533.1 hypothetical protein MELLADRAFT_115294 [Melampsora larici-populina 98AG31]